MKSSDSVNSLEQEDTNTIPAVDLTSSVVGDIQIISEKFQKEVISNYIKEEIKKEVLLMQSLVKEEIKVTVSEQTKIDKASLFTVFGIFASIVTFVSVEIQVFKTICDIWILTGFTLVILASLLIFILLLDYI